MEKEHKSSYLPILLLSKKPVENQLGTKPLYSKQGGQYALGQMVE